MTTFYKVVAEGLAGDQVVDNIFFYVDESTDTAAFDPAKMGDLALAFDEQVLGVMCTGLSTEYAGQQITVSVVDESNVVTSPYEVFVGSDQVGAVSGATPGFGACAIYGFRVGPFGPNPAARVPKRSYIALGPLSIAHVAPDGEYTASGTIRNNITLALASVVEGVLGSYRPCRVGRPSGTSVPSWGYVVGSVSRPNTSNRKSRRRRPSA